MSRNEIMHLDYPAFTIDKDFVCARLADLQIQQSRSRNFIFFVAMHGAHQTVISLALFRSRASRFFYW
jgi:hypothetical protein